jgi:integrase
MQGESRQSRQRDTPTSTIGSGSLCCIEEIQRLLQVASERRNSARWALALALGLRQGEALGLRWEDVDLDHGVLRVRRSRLRPRYAHGCGGTCGQHQGSARSG